MKPLHRLLLPLLAIGSGALAAAPLPTGGVLQPPTSSEPHSNKVPPLEIPPSNPRPQTSDAESARLKIVVKSLHIAGA